MTEELSNPDYVFEASWEVCNMVGGIYTVLSTRAASLQQLHKDRIIFVGPDFGECNRDFVEMPGLFKAWRRKASEQGLSVRAGRWNVPGKPLVLLIRWDHLLPEKDTIYGNVWEWFGVDSLHAFGDYDESCLFGWACGQVMASFIAHQKLEGQQIIAHFNEWTTGFGLFYCKRHLPFVSTVFTTHATSIGRSICGNGKPLYDFLSAYNGDQMARELNMESKHSVEKTAARLADCFTTVSDITAEECRQLLDKAPDVVTPNGFEDRFVPRGKKFSDARQRARASLIRVAEAVCGCTLSEDVLFVGTGGRYEFRNKGLDVFIESLYQLRQQKSLEREVVAFLLVPGNVSAPRSEVLERLSGTGSPDNNPLYYPWTAHWLNDIENDSILNAIRHRDFRNQSGDLVKVIFVPCYLKGDDGVFNLSYYDLLAGFDLTVFPSYYEPWGYTPLESIAFSVPTITTNLAGFGAWALKEGDQEGLSDGVGVVYRNDHNVREVCREIALQMLGFTRRSDSERKLIAERARQLSFRAHWSEFIRYYQKAYSIAVKKRLKSNRIV